MDQTRGSENSNAKEAEAARDQREPMQRSLDEACLISLGTPQSLIGGQELPAHDSTHGVGLQAFKGEV